MKELCCKKNYTVALISLIFVAIYADANAITWLQNFCWLSTSFLSFLIIWSGGEYLDAKDKKLMKCMVTLVFCADIVLFLKCTAGGFLIFWIVHVKLWFRHVKGMKEYLKHMNIYKVLEIITITLICVLFFKFTMYDLVIAKGTGNPYYWFGIVHGVLCMISVWCSFFSVCIGKLPRANALFAAIAISGLVICDTMIGIQQFIPQGSMYTFIDTLNGVFYKLFLVLLPWSSYKLPKVFEPKQKTDTINEQLLLRKTP